jgi:calmodulin
MALHLSEQDLQEFREVFNLVDTDRGGSISSEELGRLMETLGIKTTKEELDLMISEIDENGNGDIDFDEFVMVMSRKVQADYTGNEVKSAFRLFVREAGPLGTIFGRDLEQALTLYGKDRLSPEDARSLVSQLDLSDGRFNFEEYVNMMMSK